MEGHYFVARFWEYISLNTFLLHSTVAILFLASPACRGLEMETLGLSPRVAVGSATSHQTL